MENLSLKNLIEGLQDLQKQGATSPKPELKNISGDSEVIIALGETGEKRFLAMSATGALVRKNHVTGKETPCWYIELQPQISTNMLLEKLAQDLPEGLQEMIAKIDKLTDEASLESMKTEGNA